MIKKLICPLILLAASTSFAATIEPQKDDQTVNDVVEMKSYDNGGIRIFLVDQQEPAARPFKVVVSVPTGGEEFTTYGSFSVGSYCSVSLSKATSKTRTETWKIRTISIPVTHYSNDTGKCDQKDTLTIEAQLMDDSESSLKAWTSKGN